jgi:predicted murein hydrolase (TIGR00659 family)
MTIDAASVFGAAASDPLFGLGFTLVIYQGASWLQRRCGGLVLLNPVLVSVAVVVVVLKLGGISYGDYMRGGQFISFLLGPATVALALPLYDNLASIRRSAGAILPSVVLGSIITSLCAMLVGHLLGASREVVLSLGAHSATTPIAMGIAGQVGGLPSLAAAFTLLTGLVGVLLYGPVLKLIRVKDWRARGLSVGIVAHGLGTARMLQVSEAAGAYGGMAIGIGGLLTSIIVPLAIRLGVGRW